MIIKTGKISKHYGEFNFIYGLVLILIAESVRDFIIPFLPGNGYFTYLMIFLLVYMVYNVLCIYIIVGSRLIYAIRHPNQSSYKADSYYTHSTIGLIQNNNKKGDMDTSMASYPNKSFTTINEGNENNDVSISITSANVSNKILNLNETEE